MPSVQIQFVASLVLSLIVVSSASAQRNFGPRNGPPNAGPSDYAPPPGYGQTQQRFFSHGNARKDELEQQKESFKQWWGDEFVIKLADLPAEGKVPEFRTPYAGHDYPDRAGGTINSLFKYDQAFHRGRQLASEFERMDVGAHQASGRDESRVPRGLFGRMRGNPRGPATPTWYGHCNGWTAAAIRHAEPQRSVVRNGVTFTPADIKGLLAEIYMYADSEFLGGIDPLINPAVLHLVLANWLGRGSHPLGMETAIGEVVINFPIFNYKSTIKPRSPRENEVQTLITYTLNVNRELDKSPPKYHRQLYFHYVLNTDNDGLISGGQYYGDSGQIDMLWTPLQPHPGGHERNKRGNPHLDIKEVLAIWRDSVEEDLRKKWLNIDPTEEDRVLPETTAIAATVPPAATPATSEAEPATTVTAASIAAPAGEPTATSGNTTATAAAAATVAESTGSAETVGSTETNGSAHP